MITVLKRYIFSMTLLLVVILLNGCTTILPRAKQKHTVFRCQTWLRQQKLATLENWHIKGAFSIQKNTKTMIANYDWLQHAQDYRLRITSTLALYSMQIIGRRGLITLWHSNQLRIAYNAEQLMQKELGWSLPVDYLLFWIRGLPAPGRYHKRLDGYGHLTTLYQKGWIVQFSRYLPVGQFDLPQILRFHHLHPSLRVKLVIKHFKL